MLFASKFVDKCPECMTALFMSNPSDPLQTQVVELLLKTKEDSIKAGPYTFPVDEKAQIDCLKIPNLVLQQLFKRLYDPSVPLCDIVIACLVDMEPVKNDP